MWQTAADELNGVGDGSVKDWKGWSSYWVDYKAKLKKKIAMERTSKRKKGDTDLSEVEKKFASILGDGFSTDPPAEAPAPTTTNSVDIKLEDPDSSVEVKERSVPSVNRNVATLPRTLYPRHSTCRPLRRPRMRQANSMTEEVARRTLVEYAKASLEESRRNGIALENILHQITRIADGFERKNPVHKAQFSHPGDGDYGSGERGVCPYGASCRRREPRHWALHEHPPGTRAPPAHQPGIRMVERRGQIFYVNAHTVHFHDDHLELEDEDGDSVDFDYEF